MSQIDFFHSLLSGASFLFNSNFLKLKQSLSSNYYDKVKSIPDEQFVKIMLTMMF